MMFWFFVLFIILFENSISIVNTEPQGNKVFDKSTIVVSLEGYNVSNPDGESVDSFQTLQPNSSSSVVLTNISSDVFFVVFQVHSFLDNVLLSLDEVPGSKNSIMGTNVGLVKIYDKTDLTFYVAYNSSETEVEVLMTVQAYSKYAPIPGGCNMEFDVEISPFLLVSYNDVMTEVSFALSSPAVPYPQVFLSPDEKCNMKPFPVQHKMYHQYFPERDFTKETYFNVLKSMMTKGRIESSGILVPEKLTGSPVKRIFATYPGTGNAFVVMSHYNGYTSIYVPSFTYGCNDLKDNNTCGVLTTTFSKLLCATALFLGLIACYFGHYFFRLEIFLFGFLANSLVSYILVSLLFNNAIALSSSVSLGLIIATLILRAWTKFGLPIISVILNTLMFGFLLASIIYYPTIDYINLWVSDINFWGIFIGIVLSCPILMVCLAEKANIISCAFLGSYVGIVSIDYYIGSNLRYIVINTIRRAIDNKFYLAVISPPFQLKDGLLVLMWGFLTLTGIKVQRLLTRNKPPYPPPSKIFRRAPISPRANVPNETTSLLVDSFRSSLFS